MKTIRLKNYKNSPDYQRTVSKCIQTVDGMESAHINLGTGEITYSQDACSDEGLLREALKNGGIETQDD
ncbi:heavy metal-binding domain-containing protein [Desulfovibrio sp. OttesenSCG-928-G15]|nr:heavy metal-binding domain-containing protein [Desulfovibrio sp. OttesenSCG-928-G15]